MHKTILGLTAALVLGACAGSGEAPTRSAGQPSSGTAQAESSVLDISRSRWVGIGRKDACGLSWAMDLLQEDDRITGRLLWEDLQYDIRGRIERDGKMEEVRAGKSATFNGALGPRYVQVSLQFGTRMATGHYWAEVTGPGKCKTSVELKRYATD
jgi:hypothetical protein